jgi:hypothetical protein
MSIVTDMMAKLSPVGIMATVYKYVAIVGIVLAIAVGSYFYGVHQGDLVSKVAIAQYVQKTTLLQNQLDKALEPQEIQILTKYITKVIHDKQTEVDNHAIIQTKVKDVPASNVAADNVSKFLSNGWVSVHDAAASDTTVDSVAAANDTPSTFTAIDALNTVNANYAACNEYREELIDLQTSISTYNLDIIRLNAANKKK